MGHKNREKELKLEVLTGSYKDVVKYLGKTFKNNKTVTGHSTDLYWKAVNNKTADFIRLRQHSDTRAEVTVKHQDRTTSLDRVEIDCHVKEPVQMRILLERLLGQKAGQIEKTYKVFFFDKHNNISVYHIANHNSIFIEIEMLNKKEIRRIHRLLVKNCPYKLKVMNKSLFELYVKHAKTDSKV